MSKDKSITETDRHSLPQVTADGVTEGLDLNDETSVQRYLDIIAPDLQVAARDVNEPLRAYAERMLSALQDARCELIIELDDLERDIEEIIDHLDGEIPEVSR